MKRFIVSIFVLPLMMSSKQAQASPEKEFIMSCTYGVLAGTLVGAASLAFVDDPGENLQRVARGASIGLYVGIGLGIYTVYVLPKQLEKEENRILEGPEGGIYQESRIPRFMMMPYVDEGGDVGLYSHLEVARF